MLKFNLKKIAVVTVVTMGISHHMPLAAEDHSQNRTESGARQENLFSKYDALRQRLEDLSKIAPKNNKSPELIQGQTPKVRITPSQAQFSEGAEILKQVKLYRERVAESCKNSDKSSKMFGEFIDDCLVKGLVFDAIKIEEGNENKTIFDLDAKKIRACKSQVNAYFTVKKNRIGEVEWKKYVIDAEINEKLTKFFNWYGASVEGVTEDSSDQASSEFIKEVEKTSVGNLCLIEEPTTQQAVNTPSEPSREFRPPQVQPQQPQQPPQVQPQPLPQNPIYQPPQQGYQGGKYDPSGLGYGGKYDPRDRRSYDYDNFKNYGDKDYSSIPYIPQTYQKGNNYTPPNNYSSPRQPPHAVHEPSPIASPFLGRGGFNLGFGFSKSYGYPYGMMPYGLPYGGYGGYGGGGYVPSYGGMSYSSTGVSVSTTIEPITSCIGSIGGCGGPMMGGCGGGLITNCGGGCGGGLITPLNPCGGNLFNNPINQFPGRIGIPRLPGVPNPWYPYNPNYNYNPMNPNRTYLPRSPGGTIGVPGQIIPPVTGGGTIPSIPPISPVNPIYNPGTNTVPVSPIRITLPRTP